MTDRYQTAESLEDQKPIPEDATEQEREQIREENEQIRQRNQQRIAAATPVGTPLNRQQAYLAAGADALQARDAMAANQNIPQEVVDFADGVIRMAYVVYVQLAGEEERIESVEEKYF